MENRTTGIHPGHDRGNQDSQDGRDVGRRIFLAGIGMACLGFIPLLEACDNVFSNGGKGNGTARTGLAPHSMRPSLDAAVPAKTETATFSLG